MNIDLTLMRQYVNNSLDENAVDALKDASRGFDLGDEELESEVMQECAEMGLSLILQSEILGESCEALEEATVDTYKRLAGYFVGQGYLSEAAAIPTNPKINVVRLNKQATLKRLQTMYVLALGRRAGDKAFKKYKVACKMKKQYKGDLFKKYGAKAERMAKKHYQATKGGKVKAAVSSAKDSVKK